MRKNTSLPGITHSITLCVALATLFSCHKDLPEASANAGTRGNNASQSTMVLTPFGYKNASQVHFLPDNHDLVVKADKILEVDRKSTQIIHTFPRRHTDSAPARSTLAPYNSGWITDAVWFNNTGSQISYFTTNWTVPQLPFDDGQTVYLFNALQDGEQESSYIIQPVLQYGPSNAGGSSYYSITNWYGYGTGTDAHYWYGTLYNVSPGTNLQGVIQLVGQNGNNYTYSSSFTGYPANSTISFTDPLPMTYAFETLEAYNIQSYMDYPTVQTFPNTNVLNPDVPMTNIQILLSNGANAPINWTAEDRVTDIDQHTNIVTQGSPNGQVNIFFTDPWTYPPTPLINGSSNVAFNAQTTSGAGGITAQPGRLVTVTVNATGPPSGSYTITFNLSGASFTDGTGFLSVTNGTASKQFYMISTGYVQWSGRFSEPNSSGMAHIGVQ